MTLNENGYHGNDKRYRVSFEIAAADWNPETQEFTIYDEEDTLELWVPDGSMVEEIAPKFVNGWYRWTNPKDPGLKGEHYYLWQDEDGNILSYQFMVTLSGPPRMNRLVGLVDWDCEYKWYQRVNFHDV